MKIYLSGPITNNPMAQQLFYEAEHRYSAMGDVINPLRHNPPDVDWQSAMRTCIQLLVHCDIIVMLADWQSSRGARLEHYIATTLGLQCIYDDMYPHDRIMQVIAEESGVTINDICGPSRQEQIVFARHLACYLIHKRCHYSYTRIGQLINRNHSTVIHAINNIDNLLSYHNKLKILYNAIIKKLT